MCIQDVSWPLSLLFTKFTRRILTLIKQKELNSSQTMMYESMIYWVLQFNSIVVCFINYRVVFPKNFSFSKFIREQKSKNKENSKTWCYDGIDLGSIVNLSSSKFILSSQLILIQTKKFQSFKNKPFIFIKKILQMTKKNFVCV